MSDLDVLRAEAEALGIKVAHNATVNSLRRRIDEARALEVDSSDSAADSTPAAESAPMTPSLSVAIMAHRQRETWVPDLVDAIDHPDVRVVWDQINDRHETGERALAAFDPSATHHLVVQDDAIVCRDLVAGLCEAVKVSGDRVLGLYVGNVRPNKVEVERRMEAAVAAGSAWMPMGGPWWGVAVVIPTALMPDLLTYYRSSQVENYDRRIGRWAADREFECWYTVPSLVDHRSSDDNPSLVPGRTSITRRARWFIGENKSATAVDWSRLPAENVPIMRGGVPTGPLQTRCWRNTLDDRLRTSTIGSQLDRQYRMSQHWVEVT
jgi:hypothetical protein